MGSDSSAGRNSGDSLLNTFSARGGAISKPVPASSGKFRQVPGTVYSSPAHRRERVKLTKRRCDPERRLTPLGDSPTPQNLTRINAKMPGTIPHRVLPYTPYTAARCPGPSRRRPGGWLRGALILLPSITPVRRVRREGPGASRLSLDRRGQVVG